MLDIKHLRTLAALRDGGTLVEAARRMHLTQSALSHQLKDLEDRLGYSLFLRKTKPLRFTRAGLELLQLADDVLPRMQQCERNLQKISGERAGRLHMVLECHSCFDWLMPAINAFRDHWPEVEIDLSTSFNFEPLPALMRGDVDLVVTSDPAETEGIYYRPLFRYESLLAVANQHPLTQKERVMPSDLSNETLIHYPVDRKRLDIFEYFLTQAGVEPKSTRQTELTLMMVQLVASGRGVACLPNWALQPYLDSELISACKLGNNGVRPTLYAAIRAEQKEAPYIKDFLSQALENCFNHLAGIEPVAEP
ncbi:MAG: LysR family transcriptional regulator [Oceanospirillaceae bacterium]|uniref:LysR family transcriptional regulator n=1 Tax=unclassified Thalassolituus TaxID=2624967 RepID=UPI000C395586|nr:MULTISPECIES: LysR family transcriptional regulator [unclassified Thalassolituus]MAS24118.1 LysR family transcriptional regulator [Oceanospirillaceae bacterium]MAX99235.1 LysR family transcriptional regulator [Oceanospirillaceae bacterium]MBL33739.1 LysR family transcriptional regulator [Oceanospirillaceae bacterium]MBS51738.1 LysR family transcriptional regulator [Oceanospirillaceae bacterium]|tara:strand:+ start:1510 stop:2433 length:924 start_codon:yes stop_codon:yes gene_type:complete